MEVKSHFDKLYESWDDLSAADKERGLFIRDNIPNDVNSILDIGCGNGLITQLYAENHEVTGLEMSAVGVKKMNDGGLKCLQGNVAELPFDNNSFDLVIASEVLEHLDEQIYQKAIAEMGRVTKRYILITVPNNENLKMVRSECPSCKSICVPWTHIRTFKLKDIPSLFKKLNFSNLKSFAFGPLTPDNNNLLTKILRLHKLIIYNKLLPGTICPICKMQKIGEKPERSLKYFLKSPLIFSICASDLFLNSLSPKSARWLLALYESNSIPKKNE